MPPVNADFKLIRGEDGIISDVLQAPTPIGAWEIEMRVNKRFGNTSGMLIASVSSGFNGQSGINITNSGAGSFDLTIPAIATSGWNPGNYAYAVRRTNSGFVTVLTQGYLILGPSIN